MKLGFSKLTLLGALCGVVHVSAINTEVTIQDWTGPAPGPGDSANGFNGGPRGSANEDNETERVNIGILGSTVNLSAIASQEWDLEAFVVVPSTASSNAKLLLIGGFNFAVGHGGYAPGDLFIKVGSPKPTFSPITDPSLGEISNLTYDYDWAVDLSSGLAGSVTANSLDSSSILKTAKYDAFRSNPYQFLRDEASSTTTGVTYVTGKSSGDVDTLTGLALALKDNPTAIGHNVLTIDLGFLGTIPSGTDLYFSYTMECGNDSIKGEYSGGLDLVPDGGMTLSLLGLGIGALAVASRKK